MDDPHDERRFSPRFEPAIETFCRVAPQGSYRDPVLAAVWNISSTGLCMMTGTRMAVGEDLAATLEIEAGEVLSELRFRVVHVTPLSSGEYLVGARFAAELSIDVVDRLVTAPP